MEGIKILGKKTFFSRTAQTIIDQIKGFETRRRKDIERKNVIKK
jgi:hypothetical protein